MAKKTLIYRLISWVTNINMAIKNKIILLASILILLIIGCLATGMIGLYQVQIAKEEGEFADKIQDSFQELRVSFEQTLMGPHDYIIHEKEDERRIFLADYENLVTKTNRLQKQIKKIAVNMDWISKRQ